MRLTEFISTNIDAIICEWERFARGIWPEVLDKTPLTPEMLRDHVADILLAIASDMKSDQTSKQSSDKSKGDTKSGEGDKELTKASESHATGRAGDGFELWALVAEYRALRASVLRLWRESGPQPDLNDIEDITRFNESIDQSLTEAVRGFTEQVSQDRELILGKEQEARALAETSNLAKDMFLATLSHEMRGPLNAIVGWVAILRRRRNNDDIDIGLDIIERSTKSQTQLIEDVLDVSRIVSGKLRLEMQSCDMREAITAGVEVVRPAANARDITVDLSLEPNVTEITCDASRIQQIVWNLVSNAIKFTPKGGKVQVSLTCEKSCHKLIVSDTGQGVSEELLPYIFDRFRQADSSTRRKFGGLGLGLSIVKHLVEAHGGTIAADSDGENLGTTFVVLFPIAAIKQSAGDKVQVGISTKDEALLESPADLPPVNLEGLHVLIVDDDSDARLMLRKALEGVGAVVMAVASADDAIAAMKGGAGQFKILISDLGMPDKDGFDLIRQIRREGYSQDALPAVALSGFAHSNDARDAIEAGFQVHMSKPVDLHHLTKTVANLTRSA